MPTHPDFRSVIVDAPYRFAVIGPGHPTPKVVLSSSNQTSDLAGFYSLKEAGFDGIVDEPGFYPTRSPLFVMLDLFGSPPKIVPPPYASVDVWVPGKAGRDELYSLIIATKDLPAFNPSLIHSFKDELSKQVERAVKAYRGNRDDELEYIGNVLSAFVALSVERMERAKSRIEVRRHFYRAVFGTYIALIGIVIGILALSAFAGSSIRSILQ